MGSKRRRTDDQQGEGAPSTAATVSIALPSTVVEDAGSLEHAATIVGALARAAAMHQVDEVVVFDDYAITAEPSVSGCAAFVVRLLQWMETPPHLRPLLDLQLPEADAALAAGLPPLHAAHHAQKGDWRPYREGAVVKSEPGFGSYIDVGLDRLARIEEELAPRSRVTLHLGDKPTARFVEGQGVDMLVARLVDATERRGAAAQAGSGSGQAACYCGFTVRLVRSLSAVWEECPYPGGYDLTIGEREDRPGFFHSSWPSCFEPSV